MVKKTLSLVLLLLSVSAFVIFGAGCNKKAEITAEDIRIAYDVTEIDINDYASAKKDGKPVNVTADFGAVKFGTPGEYTVTISADKTTVEKKVYIYGAPSISGQSIITVSWRDAGSESALKAGLSAKDYFGNDIEIVAESSIEPDVYGRYNGNHVVKFTATDVTGQTAEFRRSILIEEGKVSLATAMCFNDDAVLSVDIGGQTVEAVYYEGGEKAETGYTVENGRLLLGAEIISSLKEGYNVLYLNLGGGYADLDVLVGDPQGEYEITASDVRIKVNEVYDYLTGVTAEKDGIAEYPVRYDDSKVDITEAGQYEITYSAGKSSVTKNVFVYGDVTISGGGETVLSWYEFDLEAITDGVTATDSFGTTLEVTLEEGLPQTAYSDYGRITGGTYQVVLSAHDGVGNVGTLSKNVTIHAENLEMTSVRTDLGDLVSDIDVSADNIISIYADAKELNILSDYRISAENKVVFTPSFLSTVIGKNTVMHINFQSGYADAPLEITDEQAPKFTMSHTVEGKYYVTDKDIPLPVASIASGSLQQLTFKYYVDGAATTGTARFSESGSHVFKTDVIRGGSVIASEEETFVVEGLSRILAANINFAESGYEWLFSGSRLPSPNGLTFAGSVADRSGTVMNALKYTVSTPGQQGYNYIYFDRSVISEAINAGYTSITLTVYIPYDGATSFNNGYSIFKESEAELLVYCGGGSSSLYLADNWKTYTFDLGQFETKRLGICPYGPEFYISKISFGGNIGTALDNNTNFALEESGFSNFFTGPRIPATNTITYGEVQAADGETRYAMTINVSEPANTGHNYAYFNLNVINAAIAAGKTKINITYSVIPNGTEGAHMYLSGELQIYNGGKTSWTDVSLDLTQFDTTDYSKNFFVGASKTISFASITFE